MRSLLLVFVSAASLTTGFAPTAVAKDKSVAKSPRLWATVNVCDTKRAPNTVGVRVSMPGSGKKGEKMYARIGLQFYNEVTRKWVSLGKGADSGWLKLGSAKYVRRETGRSFRLKDPQPNESFRIRGLVRYEWRIGKVAVRMARKATSKRSSKVIGSDPAGYSAAECTVAAP